jgi:hypothetical protein
MFRPVASVSAFAVVAVSQLIGGALGYSLRPGAHAPLREDRKVSLDFADKHLGRPLCKTPASNEETAATILVTASGVMTSASKQRSNGSSLRPIQTIGLAFKDDRQSVKVMAW